MKHLQLYRNTTLFESRDAALSKWSDSTFLSNLVDGEFITARYKEGDKVYVMTGHVISGTPNTIIIHDIAKAQEGIEANAEYIEKINESCGFEDGAYSTTASYISGSTSLSNSIDQLANALKDKVSYDATTHSLIIDGDKWQMNVGQLLSDIVYDKDKNTLTLKYKNASGEIQEVGIDMTDLINDALSTGEKYAFKDSNTIKFEVNGNDVSAEFIGDIDKYEFENSNTIEFNVSGNTVSANFIGDIDCGTYD